MLNEQTQFFFYSLVGDGGSSRHRLKTFGAQVTFLPETTIAVTPEGSQLLQFSLLCSPSLPVSSEGFLD